tara:strand:- start:354 stop:500 length:147 start_codon:yes stop_codon:yes gene_type:complete
MSDDQASKNNIKFTEQESENDIEHKLKHKLLLFKKLLTIKMKENNPAL